ncbi:MAG: glycosyltransferase [Saprospiraceae bacterium]|nr:glycosyltransferase [Saprospiraceae bacterium]
MRILITSNHTYPAQSKSAKSYGFVACESPSGSAQHIQDLLAKGLAERGHDVFYYLPKGWDCDAPAGVKFVSQPIKDFDIFHDKHHDDIFRSDHFMLKYPDVPYVTSCHVDFKHLNRPRSLSKPSWIYVSETLASAYQSDRFVWNGLDPDDFVYKTEKEDYILFISALGNAKKKGLHIALELSRKMGFKLVIAGGAREQETIDKYKQIAKEYNAEYLGDIKGRAKAELYANAKAVLFPTQLNEACGLITIEALMSGTPIIASTNGACPELIDTETGFTCSTEAEYIYAIENIPTIDPAKCRAKAIKDYNYKSMAEGYEREYQKEINYFQSRSKN